MRGILIVVAHFHYVMMGGTVIAFLGGLHYWWPKIWGRMYSEKWARVSAALIFFGFNLTFIPQFIMGSQGMPRRYWQYAGMQDTDLFHFHHMLSTIGSWMLGLAFIIMLIYSAFVFYLRLDFNIKNFSIPPNSNFIS